MVTRTVTGNYETGYPAIVTVGDLWVFTKDSSIYRGSARAVDNQGDHNSFNLKGSIQSEEGDAFYSTGDDTSVVATKTSRLLGDVGIVTYGENVSIQNAGLIDANVSGVEIFSAETRFSNSGRILSDMYGVIAIGEDISLFNGLDGKIIAADRAVYATAGAGVTHFTNYGLIRSGGDWAYYGSDGDDHVVNKGTIDGGVRLGEGADTFDGRGGVVKNTTVIYGGGGFDTLITDTADLRFFDFGNDNQDVVKSTVTYDLKVCFGIERLALIGKKNVDGFGSGDDDILYGNKGDNKLVGRSGTDGLWGFAGNDVLVGGSGERDDFHFGKGYDHDRIKDFEVEHDYLFLTGFDDIGDVSDLYDHAVNVKGGVRISEGKDALILDGIRKDDIDMDFNLVT